MLQLYCIALFLHEIVIISLKHILFCSVDVTGIKSLLLGPSSYVIQIPVLHFLALAFGPSFSDVLKLQEWTLTEDEKTRLDIASVDKCGVICC